MQLLYSDAISAMPRDISTPNTTPPGAGSLVTTLQRLGFTDHEARAYLTLSRITPATAYEVAKVSGLPRANVYGALRTLAQKGAIQPVTEDPVRYALREPDEYFGDIERGTAALCSSITRAIKQHPATDSNLYVWVARGAEAVQVKIVELIASAQRHLWIKAPEHLIAPLLPAITVAAERHVSVKLIVFGSGFDALKAHRNIVVFAHEGDGVSHHGAVDVLFTMTVDADGVMIATHGREVVGSYTRNHSIVYVIRTLMLHEIYFAEIHAAFGPQLEKRFGKQLHKLRKKYRPQGMEQSVLDNR